MVLGATEVSIASSNMREEKNYSPKTFSEKENNAPTLKLTS